MQQIYKIIQFIRELIFGKNIEEYKKTKEDIICVLEFLQLVNKFRLDNMLLPYYYSNQLEKVAEDLVLLNYNQGLINFVSSTYVHLKFRCNGMEPSDYAVISLESTGDAEDFLSKLLFNQEYRSYILSGFLNKVGIAKAGNFISIILIK